MTQVAVRILAPLLCAMASLVIVHAAFAFLGLVGGVVVVAAILMLCWLVARRA